MSTGEGALGGAVGATSMRTHLCGALSDDDVGAVVRLCGWVGRRREHGEHLAFVDLRDFSGVVQCVVDGTVDVRSECVIAVTGPSGAVPRVWRTRRLATGRLEVGDCTVEVLSAAEPPPFARRGPGGGGRGGPPPLPLRRPPPAAHAGEPPAAGRGQRGHPGGHGATGLLRGGDPAAVGPHPRGGAGVRRPEPAAPRLVLRAAPEPPAGQAALDGVGPRPLLPDRPVPARRGPAGRPAIRVHPARHGDVLRRPRTTCSASCPRPSWTPPRRPPASAPAPIETHDMGRGHGPLRLGQAGPAFRDGAGRPRIDLRRHRGAGLRPGAGSRRHAVKALCVTGGRP